MFCDVYIINKKKVLSQLFQNIAYNIYFFWFNLYFSKLFCILFPLYFLYYKVYFIWQYIVKHNKTNIFLVLDCFFYILIQINKIYYHKHNILSLKCISILKIKITFIVVITNFVNLSLFT